MRQCIDGWYGRRVGACRVQTMTQFRFFFTTGGSNAATIACAKANLSMMMKAINARGNGELGVGRERDAYLVENILETLLGKSRTLNVLNSAEFARKTFTLL